MSRRAVWVEIYCFDELTTCMRMERIPSQPKSSLEPLFCLSLALRWEREWRSVWRPAMLLSVVALVSFLVLDRFGQRGLGGLDQRIFLAATLIWMWISSSFVAASPSFTWAERSLRRSCPALQTSLLHCFITSSPHYLVASQPHSFYPEIRCFCEPHLSRP